MADKHPQTYTVTVTITIEADSAQDAVDLVDAVIVSGLDERTDELSFVWETAAKEADRG